MCFVRHTKINFLLLAQELNVKKLTVSSDKDRYGGHLKAEPDNQVLGRRLKGAFKQVSQAIKGQFEVRIKLQDTRPISYYLKPKTKS